MVASSLDQIVDLTLDLMINGDIITEDQREPVKLAMLKKHRHQFEGTKKVENGTTMTKLPIIRSLAEIGKKQSSSKSKNKINNFSIDDFVLTPETFLATQENENLGLRLQSM